MPTNPNPNPTPINPDPSDPDPRPKPEPQIPCVTIPILEGTVNLLDTAPQAAEIADGEEENALEAPWRREIAILQAQVRILRDQNNLTQADVDGALRLAIENWEHDHNGGTE